MGPEVKKMLGSTKMTGSTFNGSISITNTLN
jgi:hypothetical protein